MAELVLQQNALGFEVHDGEQLVALYRALEELPRTESPKPCFAPIYTPSGGLITEYRPADHAWHTGLFFGWVHVGDTNLWGGPWYLPEKGGYEYVDHSHGIQRHDRFTRLDQGAWLGVEEELTWLDAEDRPLARERRQFRFGRCGQNKGYLWSIDTSIEPVGEKLVMEASRAARYSGLVLRMGPPFADARHLNSEGQEGHEAIMGQPARWVSAVGAAGGGVVMMDHPDNIRHPVTWFTRKNLLGTGLLMEGDLELNEGEQLVLRQGLAIVDRAVDGDEAQALYGEYLQALEIL
ncbi:MAG: hypothetical protein GKR89_13235 [Candidatus Latescibacteria bacterium]|nr:hypothetical protein [Candidatus Latescibacterota bacterium]